MNRKPLILIGSLITLLVLIAISILILGGQSFEKLPVTRYMDESSNFTGNRYYLEGRVVRQLGVQEEVGRLILVNTETHMEERQLPVFIPEFVRDNVESGVRYRFNVWVRNTQGMTILEVQKIHKL